MCLPPLNKYIASSALGYFFQINIVSLFWVFAFDLFLGLGIVGKRNVRGISSGLNLDKIVKQVFLNYNHVKLIIFIQIHYCFFLVDWKCEDCF